MCRNTSRNFEINLLYIDCDLYSRYEDEKLRVIIDQKVGSSNLLATLRKKHLEKTRGAFFDVALINFLRKKILGEVCAIMREIWENRCGARRVSNVL